MAMREPLAPERLQRATRLEGVRGESRGCERPTQDREEVAGSSVVVQLETARRPRLLNDLRTHSCARNRGDDRAGRGRSIHSHRAGQDVEGQAGLSTHDGTDLAAECSHLLRTVEAVNFESQGSYYVGFQVLSLRRQLTASPRLGP